jgi:hypothetical protein
MTASDRNPFDLLRDANPVDEASIPATVDHQPAQRTLATIRDRQPARSRPRRLVWAIAAILIALLLAAAAIVVTRKASNTVGITCYAEPSRNADRAGVAPSWPTAIETCAQAWRDGRIGRPPQEPPALVGCVFENDVVGVFPSDDPGLCDRLGLDRHDPSQRFDSDPAVILARRIADHHRAVGCPDAATKEAFIRQQFADLGLTNWKVRPLTSPPPRPGLCTTGVVDSKGRAVALAYAPPSNATNRTTN